MEEKKDVDLYEELRKTLDTDKESEEKETPGASSDKPEDKAGESKKEPEDENAELSEDDISKLSPRAQKRIREQAEEIKRLAELSKEKEISEEKEKAPQDDDKKKDSPQNFKNVQEFLSAVQDEPSRNLLSKFYEVIKGETSSILAPIERANIESKFETEFSKYDKIEGISDYKNDLKKTFLRNPNQSLKALVGEVLTDLQINKVKPVESSPSSPNRSGKIDLDGLSKDDLYAQLDTLRE